MLQIDWSMLIWLNTSALLFVDHIFSDINKEFMQLC